MEVVEDKNGVREGRLHSGITVQSFGSVGEVGNYRIPLLFVSGMCVALAFVWYFPSEPVNGVAGGSTFSRLFPGLVLAIASGCAGFAIGLPSRKALFESEVARENLRQANYSLEEEIRLREEINAKLRHAHQVLSSHVENSPLAVVHWDRDLRVKLWSNRAEEMFGLSSEQAMGKTPAELEFLNPRELEFFDSKMSRLLHQVESYSTVFCRHTLPGKNEVVCRWYNSALLDEEGKVYSILSLGLDETQRQRAQKRLLEYAREIDDKNQALDEALEKANCATQAKSEFLASMSHEIRTPMNGIIGMAGLLMDTDLTPEQRDYSRTIMSCSEGLLTIINDILDFSKIEAGKLDLESIEFDLRETVEDTLDLLAKQSYEKRISLACFVDHEVPKRLIGDPTRIRQVLLNFLNNALKFTDEGTVQVRIRMEADRGDRVVIRSEVEDTGIGIPEDKQDRLFQTFSQVDASTTRKYGGTGLGLAICKDLAELMNGTVGVESVEGEGSTFWFTMQLERVPGDEREEAGVPGLEEFRGKRVSVATEETVIAEVLKHHFQGADVSCEAFCGLQDLMDRIGGESVPDVMVLDSRLGGLRPAELAHRIHREEPWKSLPLIFIAPRGVDYEVPTGRNEGRIEFLRKPIREKSLWEVLHTSLVPVEGDPVDEGVAVGDHDHRATPLHREYRILVAEDNPVNQKITTKILEKKGYSVHLASNGEEALEILAAMKFDLVLMDCQMPVMDGYEATRTLREREEATGERIPVIAMTANAMKGDREKCLEAGMDGYLSKPVKPESLYSTLREHLPRTSV